MNSNGKPIRKIESLTLKEVNEILAKLEQLLGVAIPEHVVVLPPLTDAQHAQMLGEVMQQVEAVCNG